VRSYILASLFSDAQTRTQGSLHIIIVCLASRKQSPGPPARARPEHMVGRRGLRCRGQHVLALVHPARISRSPTSSRLSVATSLSPCEASARRRRPSNNGLYAVACPSTATSSDSSGRARCLAVTHVHIAVLYDGGRWLSVLQGFRLADDPTGIDITCVHRTCSGYRDGVIPNHPSPGLPARAYLCFKNPNQVIGWNFGDQHRHQHV